MIPELKPIAALVGSQREYAQAAKYVTSLDVLPLGRIVNDAKVTDHHAIIPTRSEHRVDKMSDDDRRIYDMVVRRFLAVFHPEAVFENTRLETTVAEHIFRTSGRILVVPGWRGVYGEESTEERAAADADDERAPTSCSRSSSRARTCARSRSSRPRRRPSRRAASPTRRCCRRWRPPASSSTTRSCARR